MKKILLFICFLVFGLISYGQTQVINVGTTPNDGTGDPIRTAFQKVNTNRTAIVDSFGVYNQVRLVMLDSLGNIYTEGQTDNVINDSIAGRVLGGVSFNSLISSKLDSLVGTGGSIGRWRLNGIVGTTTGFPVNGDSLVINSAFITHPDIDVFREGLKQRKNTSNANAPDGFKFTGSTGTITFKPVLTTGELIEIVAYDPIITTELSPEGGAGGGGGSGESNLLTGLIGYYALDEIAGTVADNSRGYLISAYLNAGINYGTVNQLGKLGRSAYFDNDVVDIAQVDASEVFDGDKVSISGWFNLDILPSVLAHESYLVRAGVSTSPWESIFITVGTNDKPVFHVKNTSTTDYEVTSTGTLSADTWYHIVAVCPGSGSALKLYINGTDVSSGAETFSGTLFANDSDWYIGNAYQAAGSGLRGYADEVAMWDNVALSGAQVTTLYNGGLGLGYPFNE